MSTAVAEGRITPSEPATVAGLLELCRGLAFQRGFRGECGTIARSFPPARRVARLPPG